MNEPVREPPVLQPVDETHVMHGNRRLTHFTGSDYLKLSWHPEVRRAAEQGIRDYGTGTCASRMTTGNLPIYGALERELARFFGAKSATLTSAGYTAPLVVAQALAGDHEVVFLDSRPHGCLRDAAVLTGLRVVMFQHGEPSDLKRRLRTLKGSARPLVFCDGLGAVDGRVGPLADYVEVLGDRGTLVVDDAHGVGVLGAAGRGSVEWAGVPMRRVVVTLTLSKAFGSYGGVVLGDRSLRDRILERSRLFTGNTPPAPPSAAAARGALAVVVRDGRLLRDRLGQNLTAIPERLRGWNWRGVAGPGPIFSVAPKTTVSAERFRRRLLEAGIYPPLIRYPNGPASQFFRFAVSSAHTESQMRELADALEAFSRAEGEGQA